MAKTYETEVKGLGIVHKVNMPFDEALKIIRRARGRVILARDLVYGRAKKGRNSSLCNIGSYVKEGVLYIPDKTIFIKNSPLLNQRLAGKAVQAHRKGKEFYVDELVKKYQEQVNQDKNKQLEKRKTLAINKRGSFNIPTNRFKDEELTLWLFKDMAGQYGDFLRQNNIDEMPVYLSGNDKKSFANQLWFGDFDFRSGLNCHSRDIGYYNGVRWVLKQTNEASSHSRKSGQKSQKIKPAHTPRQLDRVLRTTQNIKNGEAGTSGLENVINFLERPKS